MATQNVLEVCTPALSHAGATDPHVLSISSSDNRFLHTSPEFAMKRLLCAYQTDIYQVANVFRAGESGRFHNTQFTLLEWYRLRMDHRALMDDVTTLLTSLWQSFNLAWPGIDIRQYGAEVHTRLGVWPEQTTVKLIAQYFADNGCDFPVTLTDDVDAALDLFMDEFVLVEFATQRFTFLTDYPVSQAALARIGKDDEGRDVAQRFELYYGRVELANGYHELTDPYVQRQRFAADRRKRDKLNVTPIPTDERLLSALEAGLPDCAGVALGLERLQMVLGQYEHIQQVLSFDDARS